MNGDVSGVDKPANGEAATPLADGEYPTFVVDVEEGVDDAGTALHHLAVTILSGPHKGEVVEIAARGLDGTFVDLIGMPSTLTVTDGTPTITIDD